MKLSDSQGPGTYIKTTRPSLRWHGGKWNLAPWIISHFPIHRVYTEAYGGAASVLMRKSRARVEIYNDLNQDLINLFRVLQDDARAKKLLRKILLTPFARDEYELGYIKVKDPIERARRFIILSFMGFGSNACSSKWRTGFRGVGILSSAHAVDDWTTYPEGLTRTIERFRGVIVENKPAVEIIQRNDGPDTLHYVDPPYVHVTRQKAERTNYGDFEMTDAQHIDLGHVLNQVKGMVILSGYACELYDKNLYSKWHRIERSALADGAKKRTEVLWLNNAAFKNCGRLF